MARRGGRGLKLITTHKEGAHTGTRGKRKRFRRKR